MATFRHGRGTVVLVDDYDLTQYFREAAITQSVDLAETSAYGTFDKTFVVGMREGRLTLGGMFDGSANAVDQVLATVLGQEAAFPVTYAPEGLTIGRRTYVLQAEEATHETSSPLTDIVATSAEFQATGGIHAARSLHALAAESSSGNGTSVNNGASTAFGATATLHVTANTRDAGSITVKVQDSPNDSTWADLVSFTAVGFGAVASEILTVTGTVDQYLRALWTVTGGTTGSYTFHVSCARRNV
jgi:hypothetical protein